MSKNNTPLESEEQKKLFEWAELAKCQYPELRWMYAIPNGGSRNPIEAKHLKEQGVKSGVPDIHLPVARGRYHSMYIELKRVEGGKTSGNQVTWLKALGELGHKSLVCFGFEEARDEIIKYLDSDKGG